MQTVVRIRNAFALLAAGCLVVLLLPLNPWILAGGVIAQALLWFASRAYSTAWRASAHLVLYLSLAVAGTILGLPELVMILGATAALAAWDLTIFASNLETAASPQDSYALRRSHLRALFIAVGLAVGLAWLVSMIELTLPFAVAAGLALALIACLVEVVQRSRIDRV